jgi:Fe-S protein assembly co-chaperone HscB
MSSLCIKPSQNPFDSLGLAATSDVTFDVTPEALDHAYHKILRVTHPDRFVGHTGAEKLAASLQASQANAAYQLLRSFYSRASAYLDLKGLPYDETHPPAPAFLMSVMTYQDSLEEAREDSDKSTALLKELTQSLKATQNDISQAFKDQAYDKAADTLSQYKYLERLVKQADSLVRSQAQASSQAQANSQAQTQLKIKRGAA